MGDVIRAQQNILYHYWGISRSSPASPEGLLLSEVIDDVVFLNSRRSGNKKLTIQRIVTGLLRAIKGVRTEINLILWNLLDNAIKFTSAKKASRIAIVERYSTERVMVSISDMGAGIHSEDLHKIWDL